MESIDHHECVVEDPALNQTISFRAADYDKDIHTLFNWMHQKHIYPFWKLNVDWEDFKIFFHHSVTASHKRVFFGFINGEPVCYGIAYRIESDPLKEYYAYKPGDLGMHLLIGPREYLNRQTGLAIIRGMSYYLFSKYEAQRIIGEPDYRNRIVIPILTSIGAVDHGVLELPHKKAKLVIGERHTVLAAITSHYKRVTWNLSKSPMEEWKELMGEEEAPIEKGS
ncbi:GNAT family N-acetyltransferase [Pontibacillus salicampi]|uniref:Lysine N-acyltransferase MbtK n=1 Tax=Pontibacillus salicampi TaxID=1449801 RepID=A0ABV6LPW6_9BACI